MISMKDYARTRSLTTSAVCQKIKRYEDDLKEHITKQNRLVYLDEYAEQFLDSHRIQKTVIVEPSEDEVKAEIDALKERIATLLAENSKQKDEIIELIKVNSELRIADSESKKLLEDHQRNEDKLLEDITRAGNENEDLKNRLQEVEAEANSYHKTWFGLYRKNNI